MYSERRLNEPEKPLFVGCPAKILSENNAKFGAGRPKNAFGGRSLLSQRRLCSSGLRVRKTGKSSGGRLPAHYAKKSEKAEFPISRFFA
ncbi:MAG: hypothetical protein IPK58_24545 [Acidobacteria bacterium]|nr:hypothetical protein [Acidobacteriota bacterium]